MAKRLHSVSTQMAEGIRISITSPRSDIQERRIAYMDIRRSIKKYGGMIVEKDKTFDTIKLTVVFPNRRKQRKWVRKYW